MFLLNFFIFVSWTRALAFCGKSKIGPIPWGLKMSLRRFCNLWNLSSLGNFADLWLNCRVSGRTKIKCKWDFLKGINLHRFFPVLISWFEESSSGSKGAGRARLLSGRWWIQIISILFFDWIGKLLGHFISNFNLVECVMMDYRVLADSWGFYSKGV